MCIRLKLLQGCQMKTEADINSSKQDHTHTQVAANDLLMKISKRNRASQRHMEQSRNKYIELKDNFARRECRPEVLWHTTGMETKTNNTRTDTHTRPDDDDGGKLQVECGIFNSSLGRQLQSLYAPHTQLTQTLLHLESSVVGLEDFCREAAAPQQNYPLPILGSPVETCAHTLRATNRITFQEYKATTHK
eukprot:GHVR01017260.1.p1 GENE.GHVR01017260.1~~GHVR01017260.1.p1  ORF type:complete len:191 (+),score=42.77 GHVR01017260.1:129-701(+)